MNNTYLEQSDIEQHMKELWAVSEKILLRSTIVPGTEDHLRFLALSLAGEAGELANKVKKRWRESTEEDCSISLDELREETIDCFNYVLLVCHLLGVRNPLAASAVKLEAVKTKHRILLRF